MNFINPSGSRNIITRDPLLTRYTILVRGDNNNGTMTYVSSKYRIRLSRLDRRNEDGTRDKLNNREEKGEFWNKETNDNTRIISIIICFVFFFYFSSDDLYSKSIVDLLSVKCKLVLFLIENEILLEGIQILRSFAWKKLEIWFQKGFSETTFNFWIFLEIMKWMILSA